ncbi:MAG: 4'-phosphopantetheinyl transferase superfamily protein [Eubacterium sp.]|nr:4'-phosphopantetheinyl transferase superfamily protein [Eubacterium sp.]
MIKVYFYKMNQGDLSSGWENYMALLPAWRQESCTRMRFERGRLQQLAAGLLLRYALMDAAGIDLMKAEVTINEHGKPGFVLSQNAATDAAEKGDVHFNISHSDDYIAVAIADRPVGIDVEVKTDPDLKVTSRFYSPAEQQAVRTASDPQREFRRLWTRKEAYVKCTGTGIYDSVAGIPSLEDQSGDYRLFTLKEEEEYALSLVVRCPEEVLSEDISLKQVEGFGPAKGRMPSEF